MTTTYYYLFKPNEHLGKELSANPDLDILLPNYFLFSHNKGGKLPFAKMTDTVAWIKLLFLAYLIMEFEHIPAFRLFFGELPISLNEFDKWWHVERFGLEGTLENVEKAFDEHLIERLSKTDMPIADEWIDNLRQRIIRGTE